MMKTKIKQLLLKIGIFLLLSVLLASCGNTKRKTEDDFLSPREKRAKIQKPLNAQAGTFFSFKTKRTEKSKEEGSRIAVNPYLWRSSLETLSFIPLLQADSSGGVIIYDWYSLPETPTTRYKVDIIITSREFRVDALKVTVFKQERKNGQWREIKAGVQTVAQIKETILFRAKQIRSKALQQNSQ